MSSARCELPESFPSFRRAFFAEPVMWSTNSTGPPSPGRLHRSDSMPAASPSATSQQMCPPAGQAAFRAGAPRLGLDLKALPRDDGPPSESQLRRQKYLFFEKQCSEVSAGLFVAGDSVAKNRELLATHGVTHVVNCVGFICKEYFKGELEYKTLFLQDTPAEDILCVMYDTFEFVDDALRCGGKVLIHCSQGVSRSATLAIAYLMWRNNKQYDEVFALVKSIRGVANPNIGFTCQLLQWQKRRAKQPSNVRMYRIAPHCAHANVYLVPKAVVPPKKYPNTTFRDLDPRGAFIVHTPRVIYIWRGEQCPAEFFAAAEYQARLLNKYEVAPSPPVVVDQGHEPTEFRLLVDPPMLTSEQLSKGTRRNSTTGELTGLAAQSFRDLEPMDVDSLPSTSSRSSIGPTAGTGMAGRQQQQWPVFAQQAGRTSGSVGPGGTGQSFTFASAPPGAGTASGPPQPPPRLQISGAFSRDPSVSSTAGGGPMERHHLQTLAPVAARELSTASALFRELEPGGLGGALSSCSSLTSPSGDPFASSSSQLGPYGPYGPGSPFPSPMASSPAAAKEDVRNGGGLLLVPSLGPPGRNNSFGSAASSGVGTGRESGARPSPLCSTASACGGNGRERGVWSVGRNEGYAPDFELWEEAMRASHHERASDTTLLRLPHGDLRPHADFQRAQSMRAVSPGSGVLGALPLHLRALPHGALVHSSAYEELAAAPRSSSPGTGEGRVKKYRRSGSVDSDRASALLEIRKTQTRSLHTSIDEEDILEVEIGT